MVSIFLQKSSQVNYRFLGLLIIVLVSLSVFTISSNISLPFNDSSNNTPFNTTPPVINLSPLPNTTPELIINNLFNVSNHFFSEENLVVNETLSEENNSSANHTPGISPPPFFNTTAEKEKLEAKFSGKKVLVKKLQKLNDTLELGLESETTTTKATITGNFGVDDVTDLYVGKNGKDEFWKGAFKYEFSTEVFAINDLDIDNADIELELYGDVDEILYCKNYNFQQETCPGDNWVSSGEAFTKNNGKVLFSVDHFSA
ncbi:hypothetical protein GOV05_02530, partial [Candidatus Woesearchaeota archaeon]|nr:hypothetical protein [Candidatus Woesearchaeota archaeon]